MKILKEKDFPGNLFIYFQPISIPFLERTNEWKHGISFQIINQLCCLMYLCWNHDIGNICNQSKCIQMYLNVQNDNN